MCCTGRHVRGSSGQFRSTMNENSKMGVPTTPSDASYGRLSSASSGDRGPFSHGLPRYPGPHHCPGLARDRGRCRAPRVERTAMTALPTTAPTATQLLTDYASCRRRPSEVLADCFATIGATEPTVSVVVELLEDATNAAAVADDQWATGEAPVDKPLLGVPVVIKEKHGIAGHSLNQAVPATAVIPPWPARWRTPCSCTMSSQFSIHLTRTASPSAQSRCRSGRSPVAASLSRRCSATARWTPRSATTSPPPRPHWRARVPLPSTAIRTGPSRRS